MPAAAAFVPLMAAGVTATGAFIASKVASHDAQKGREAQMKSENAALDYTKGRDTIGDQRYADKMKLYQEYLADYKARHGGAAGGATGGGGGAAPMQISLSDLVNGQQGASAPPGAQAAQGSVADLANGGDVFDWRRYGA